MARTVVDRVSFPGQSKHSFPRVVFDVSALDLRCTPSVTVSIEQEEKEEEKKGTTIGTDLS